MLIAYWILATPLALVYVLAGVSQLAMSKADLVAAGVAAAEVLPDALLITIGMLELAGAIGLILPMLTGVAVLLGPLSAALLALVQLAAAALHLVRMEPEVLVLNAPLLLLAAATATVGFLALRQRAERVPAS
ncbi:DoxX family protein [Agromyces sp. SYSU T00194]|uniref:DoxX family protein n=1 Tax=Agromyces chitinivorans TaxID=3158560 RepID=UPI003393BCA2